MPGIGSLTTKKLLGILVASGGISETVSAFMAEQNITVPAVTPQQVIAQNVAPELSERSTATKYPIVYTYCTKIANFQREKFRTFSGDATMVVESRVSQDRLEGIEAQSQFYVDAITEVLNSNRGDWGDGVFYSGGYEVTFGGVKQGGRNFIQITKVSFVVEVSTD